MDREINLNSIQALEKQIEEHEKALIQLKRTRNSLLNVSALLPPEILGKIFCWNAIRDGDFGDVSKGSYNFLLVCHHWFEVASHTPELWSFWGSSMEDWLHRHARHTTAPLDLVLSTECAIRSFNDRVRDTLQDRAAQDTIRQVHLRATDSAKVISSIISSTIIDGEETRSSSVESFIVQNGSPDVIVDVSAFFSRYHLPKLHCLRLLGCRISSRDLLKSRISTLTTLELANNGLPPTLSLSQMLSILTANPLLQCLILSNSSVPHIVDGCRSSTQVQLRHLKVLRLAGDLHNAFGLLTRLGLPDKMDDLRLDLSKCSPSVLSQGLWPYLGNHVRRRGRSPGDGLEFLVNPCPTCLRFCAGDAYKHNDSTRLVWFVTVETTMSVPPEKEEAYGLCFDLAARVPWEQVIKLQTTLPILRSEDLCVGMRNLIYLDIAQVDLSRWFAEPVIRRSHAFGELLPNLDHIAIIHPFLSGNDWSPLTNFLSRRATAGKRVSSLRIRFHPHMDKGVVESIERVVKVFKDEDTLRVAGGSYVVRMQ